jgi:uncharacterized repeat protein (TIGR01451 family)
MFEKLLSLLPYNPGLLHQMSFYSHRMRAEAAIRRTGLIVLGLAFMVQFLAVVSPPVTTSAYSTNDLVDGGISSAADAKNKCVNNVKHYKDIMETFGISCDDIGGASTVQLSSTNYSGDLYSMGWIPQGQTNPNTHRSTNEVPISVLHLDQNIYARLLHSWDTGPSSTYTALKFKDDAGHTFFILFNCGNLVTIGAPQPLQRCRYNSDILASSDKCFKPCQYNTSISSESSACFKPCIYNGSIASSSAQCFAPCPLPGLSSVPQNSAQCAKPAQPNQPAPTCPYNSSLPPSSPQCFQPCQYNSSIASSSPSCVAPCQYNGSLLSNSPDCFQPCQYNNLIAASDSSCKPCDKSLSTEDTLACVSVHKTASDTTAGVINADGTTAQPGDVITYTLYATNNGKADVKAFTFQEDLSDTLVYSDPLNLNGGSLDSNNILSWPSEPIPAGSTVNKVFTVKVKDPIPDTPADPGDPNRYDLIMTNVYGNAVNIHVPQPPAKAVEAAATTLPNTGPGTGVVIAALIVIVGGYFYSRARLLGIESKLAVSENAGP